MLGEILFGFLVVATLVLIHWRREVPHASLLVGVIFQLIAGMLFGIGILGEGIAKVRSWIKRYFSFTKEPLVAMVPLQTALAVLQIATNGMGENGKDVVRFATYGVTIIIVLTSAAHYKRIQIFIARMNKKWLRVSCIALGVLLYCAGQWIIG